MNVMKTIYKFLILITAVAILGSCGDPEDLMTADATEGGAIVTVDKSSGKALGVPLSDGSVSFAEVELSYTVELYTGGYDVVSYDIVKSLNGGDQVVIANTAKLPFTLEYATIDEFVDGLGVTSDQLVLGDEFTFSTVINLSDGRKLQTRASDGSYNVVVNCSSNLAGSYTMVGLRGDGGTYSYPVTITETGPGQYVSSRSGSWAPTGVLATPTGEAPMVWTDNCGQLLIPQQDLGDFYSNQVYGNDTGEGFHGSVDGNTGVITYFYTIEFSSGNQTYLETLTPN